MNKSWEPVFVCVSAAYIVLLLICFGAYFFMPYIATEAVGHAVRGCHLTGELIYGATCHGFWGAGTLEVLLSIPLALLLLPFAGLSVMSEISEGAEVGRLLLGATGFSFGVSLWAPIIYFIAYARRVTLREAPLADLSPKQ